MKLTDKTGEIVAAGMVSDDDGVMLMNTSGIAIRIAARQVSRIGRTTQGVKLMRLGSGEEVGSATIMAPRDPAAEAQAEGVQEAEIGADGAAPVIG
jgi:DNA gyrase subunit A